MASEKSRDEGDFSPWDTAFEEAEAFYQEGLAASENRDWLKAEESFDLSLNSLAETPAKDASQTRIKKAYVNRIIDALTDISAQSLASRISEGMTPENPNWYNDTELPSDSSTQYLLHHLVDGIDLSRFELPIEVNERVIKEIYRFAYGNSKTFTQASLRRMVRYQNYISERLRQEGMPKELIYLALVESGFSPGAQSPAKASGVWQFIPATGKMYGLDINWWIDERRDPYQATNGAINYLKKLYREFGDWYLAMAAYNCGEGCVRRALRNSSDSSYWNLGLPQETKQYVPRILAVSIIASNPEKYNLKPAGPPSPRPDTMTIPGCIPLAKLGSSLGLPLDTMVTYNPELRQKMTPPNIGHLIKVPTGYRNTLSKVISEQGQSLASCTQRHRVAKGESLIDIAKKYRVSLEQILSANGASSSFRVKKGQFLTIPSASINAPADSTKVDSTLTLEPTDPAMLPALEDEVPDFHTVKKGESLSNIASKYDLDLSDLKRWNNLRGNSVARGKKLRLKPSVETPAPETKVETPEPRTKPKDSENTIAPSEATQDKNFRKSTIKQKIRHSYTVKPKENIADVARKTGSTTAEIMSWNRLTKKSRLRAGQEIVWYEEKSIVVLSPDRKKPEPKTSDKNTETDPVVNKPSLSSKIHTVTKGQSLESIAKIYGVSIDELREWNQLKTKSQINKGQKLVIKFSSAKEDAKPSKSKIESSDPQPRKAKPETRPTSYRTRKGDTINSVAKKFGISTAQLKKWNGIRGNSIAPGSTLIIKKD